jgi:hypothetical protein
MHVLGRVLLESFLYDLLKGVALSTTSVLILRKAFGVLKQRKEAIYFWGGGVLVVALTIIL